MIQKNCEFSFTGYEFADENGKPNGKKVYVPATINYKQALKNTIIWTSTVMLNLDKLTKSLMQMPNIDRGQDTATWWKILKTIYKAYGVNEILSIYRRNNKSLSANKLSAIHRTWKIYRQSERLNLPTSCYCFIFYLLRATKRRI